MRVVRHKITLINLRRPAQAELNEELQWFGNSLGLFNLRDKDRSCFRIFIELLKAARARHPLSSDEIAFKLGLTRGTVVHHINKLIESGIVEKASGGYVLIVGNLSDLVDEIEKDLLRTTSNLRKMANEIDQELGL